MIVSVPDATWILTASHVVDNANDLKVELHRFNFGSRITGLTEGGGWPRLVPATVAAIDRDGDVALVRIKGMKALPFVARLDPDAGEPTQGEVMTSVGIDRGLHLTSWRTRVEGTGMIDMGKGGGKRPFTVTSHPPDHGRSGGGLFRGDGAVLGVCTGFFENKPGQNLGAFAAMDSVRKLIRGAIPRQGRSARPFASPELPGLMAHQRRVVETSRQDVYVAIRSATTGEPNAWGKVVWLKPAIGLRLYCSTRADKGPSCFKSCGRNPTRPIAGRRPV